MNKTFATFKAGLKKDRYLESIQASLLLLQSYRRFPSRRRVSSGRFRPRTFTTSAAGATGCVALENHGKKERVAIDEYTIEHIMPQSEPLPPAWRKELGPEWERIHATYLHTLGNLTLTGYNSEYGNRPFTVKRDREERIQGQQVALE
ncbi:MAG: HNH endonuclease family protein [Ferruginibacter sp.]